MGMAEIHFNPRRRYPPIEINGVLKKKNNRNKQTNKQNKKKRGFVKKKIQVPLESNRI